VLIQCPYAAVSGCVKSVPPSPPPLGAKFFSMSESKKRKAEYALDEKQAKRCKTEIHRFWHIRDLVHLLCTFLHPVDVWSLTRCSKTQHAMLAKLELHTVKRLRQAYVKMGLPEEAMHAISKSHGFITGSSLLKLINGDAWQSNDIDVFVLDENTPFNDWCCKSTAAPPLFSEYPHTVHSNFKGSRVFTIGDAKVNLTELAVAGRVSDHPFQHVAIECVNKFFDYDFLKIIFTGSEVITTERGAVMSRTTAQHVCGLYKDWITSKHGIAEAQRRREKYTERGFVIRDVCACQLAK